MLILKDTASLMQRRCRGFSHVPAAPQGGLRNIADLFFSGRQARREKKEWIPQAYLRC
ncbi:hypothetical protein ACFSQ7_43525 [Paenibacillus rhizoplanae]